MALPVPEVIDGYIQPNYALFRQLFPAFANETDYPDSVIDWYWCLSWTYLDGEVSCLFDLQAQFMMLNYVTAHLMAYNDLIAAGTDSKSPFGGNTIAISSTIGDVSATVMPPPVQDNYYFWFFSQTPYGSQYIAMLKANTAGGFYLGGSAVMTGLNAQNDYL